MSPGPAITVVIPHYGDPAPTQALVAQLEKQGVAHHLVVVDDASPVPFPPLRVGSVIRRHQNGGFGSAVNTGAESAVGDLLLILNSDLLIPADFLTTMLDASARFPRAVLSPQVNDEDGNPVHVGRNFPRVRHHVIEWLTPLARWRNSALWHRGVGHALHPPDEDRAVDWVIGAALLVPLVEFRRIGGFDERFYMNSEEVDLQRRLRRVGVRAVALGSPSVTHLGGGSTPSDRRREWVTTSRLQYADKWGSVNGLRAGLAAATMVNLAVNSVRRARGRDVRPWATARRELQLLRGPTSMRRSTRH